MRVLLNASNVLPDAALCLKYGASERVLRVGTVTISFERIEVAAGGQIVELTRKEFALLQLLMMRKNVVMAKEAILEQIYGRLDEPDPKIIDILVCRIRNKLVKAGVVESVIRTISGRGYAVCDVFESRDGDHQPRIPQPAAPLGSRLVVA